MNVLILEMGGSHFENVYSLIHLLRLKKCNIYLACNKSLIPLLPDKELVQGLLPLPDEFTVTTKLKCFFKIRKYIKAQKIKALIIGTTEIKIIRDLSFFLPNDLKIAGIVHNTKKLEKSVTFSRILYPKIRKYIVLGDYLLQELKADRKYEIISLFPVFYPPVKHLKPIKENGDFWLVIPGIVESARRDYIKFLEVLANVQLPLNYKIIFLGFLNADKEQEINTLLQSPALKQKNIITFTEYVDYSTFHSYIQQTDVLLPLLKITDDFYGKNRISGTFHLSIAYHVPLLMHDSYKNPELKEFTMYYSNYEELQQLLAELPMNNELVLLKEAFNRSNTYDEKQQAERLMELIQKD